MGRSDGSWEGGDLRIAFLGDPTSPHTHRWMRFFADRGHRVHLLVAEGQTIPSSLDAAVSVHRFVGVKRQPLPLVGTLRARWSLTRLVKRIRPDVLHAHYVTRYAWWAWLSAFHPYVVTAWGSDLLLTLPQSRRERIWARIALGGADAVTAPSKHLMRAAIRAGAKPERVHLIQFGVDTIRFAPGEASAALRQRLGLHDRRIVFSPRRIAPLYRQESVVAALSMLPGDVVVLMGEKNADNAYLSELRELAKRAGVGDRLVTVPEIADSEMPDFYRIADVVVSVPGSDGLPVSVLEAMATGVPVVATDLMGAREALERLTSDLLVPVGDAKAIAAAIRRALSFTASERDRLGDQLRAAVVDSADQRQNMLNMEAVYRSLSTARK